MYSLEISDYARGIIARQDSKNQRLLQSKLDDLQNGNFTRDRVLKGKYKGKFRKRAGNFRIIYIKEEQVLIICIIHNRTQERCRTKLRLDFV